MFFLIKFKCYQRGPNTEIESMMVSKQYSMLRALTVFHSFLALTSGSSSSTSNSYTTFTICDDAPIQVQNISYFCDSPYTFYYGNGAHRKSPVCDYGDRVTILVDLNVETYVDSTIYMALSAYSDSDEQLFLEKSIDLCGDLVGKSCNSIGSYYFTKTLQFAYLDGEETKFVPNWEIVFSVKSDGGFDLGAVNIECDREDEKSYFDWQSIRGNTTLLHARTENFAQEYGILLITCISIVFLGIIMINKTKKHLGDSRQGSSSNRSFLLESKHQLS
jgi:hypothetical protein